MAPPGQSQRSASKFIVFEHFEKMNTQSIRQALSEKEMAWLENLQPIAPNNFVSIPAPAISLTSISETIISQFFASIGGVDYIVSCTSAGSGWATNIANAVTTIFAPPGTFTNPDMTVWQSSYALFNDTKSGYAAWNGTVFVRQGGVSPVINLTAGGSGYTSVPSVSITGGSGTGATAVATIGTPQVNAVNVINGGSQYATPPGVVFAGGGGSGAAATANIDPRGVVTVTVTNGGSYVNGNVNTPACFTSGGGGGGASLLPIMAGIGGANFTVVAIQILLAGSGFTSAPNILFSGGIPIVGATATCTVGNGAVTSITVTNGGSGYTSAPSVSFTGGGGGSGATAAAVIGGSFVATIALTSPGGGYLASDSLTVSITGGAGTGATATAHVWPFVTAGSTLAVFQGRVWLGGNRLLQYTGTGGFDDFNTANASGSLTIGDADLTHAITALRNYNNYLFIMGDQSVKQIGNITVSGSTTLFTILTLSSDQGTIYPLSCGSFNRVYMFVNSNGVYAVLGSSVQKISDDLDGIFKLIDFTQEPQAALIDINGVHNIAFLVKYKDPLASTRSILLVFNGKKWFVVSQGNSLVSITTASKLSTGTTLTFGSSGPDVTQLVAASPTTPIAFKVQTALTHHGNAVQRKKTLAGGVAASMSSGTGSITVTFDSENGSVTTTYNLATGFDLPGGASGAEASGRYLGMTITGTLAGFTFTNAALEYQETSLWK